MSAAFAASQDCFGSIQGWLDGADSSGLDHGELEAQLDTRGRELLRQLLQDHLELRAVREDRIDVADSDGTRRTRNRTRARPRSGDHLR